MTVDKSPQIQVILNLQDSEEYPDDYGESLASGLQERLGEAYDVGWDSEPTTHGVTIDGVDNWGPGDIARTELHERIQGCLDQILAEKIQRQTMAHLFVRVKMKQPTGIDFSYMQRRWSSDQLRAALSEARDLAVANGWTGMYGTVKTTAQVDLSNDAIAVALATEVRSEVEFRGRLRPLRAQRDMSEEQRDELIRLVSLRTRLSVETIRRWRAEDLQPYLAELTDIREREASEFR